MRKYFLQFAAYGLCLRGGEPLARAVENDTINIEPDGYHLGRYIFACQYVDGLNVLDLATGPGYGAEMLLDDGGARSVIGIDISQELIDYASSKHSRPGIEFLVGNGLELGFEDNCFDSVVSLETIEHISDYIGFLDGVARVLRKDGTLIISTPNRSYDSRNKLHVSRFSSRLFLSLLEERFETVEAYGQDPMKVPARFLARANRIAGYIAPSSVLKATYKLKTTVFPTTNPVMIRTDDPGRCRYLIAVCSHKRCRGVIFEPRAIAGDA
jgi:SAM-dependent methyltransferase